MRGDQRLEREKPDARRRCYARVGTRAALALALASAASLARTADRPDFHIPEEVSSLPEPSATLPSPPEAESPAGLRLFWFDPNGLAPFVFEPTSREVSRIFRDVGVSLRWERGDFDTTLGQGPLDIPVILLPADPMAKRASRRVMGLVPRQSSGPRAVWVFLSSVRWTLGHDPRASRITTRQANELGLALARVVAHEVVHAIVPDEPHTNSGLMHHSMDRSFLLGMKAPIGPDCGRAFVRSLDDLLTPPYPSAARIGVEQPSTR
jgi:hypothetical protein